MKNNNKILFSIIILIFFSILFVFKNDSISRRKEDHKFDEFVFNSIFNCKLNLILSETEVDSIPSYFYNDGSKNFNVLTFKYKAENNFELREQIHHTRLNKVEYVGTNTPGSRYTSIYNEAEKYFEYNKKIIRSIKIESASELRNIISNDSVLCLNLNQSPINLIVNDTIVAYSNKRKIKGFNSIIILKKNNYIYFFFIGSKEEIINYLKTNE